MKPTWLLEEGVALARKVEIETSVAGWHCGLGGSTLHKGCSYKDVDLILFPHCRKGSHLPRLSGLRAALRRAGGRFWRGSGALKRHWRKIGSKDQKHVEVWVFDSKRVDILVLS